MNLIVEVGPVVVSPGHECTHIFAFKDGNLKQPNFKRVSGEVLLLNQM